MRKIASITLTMALLGTVAAFGQASADKQAREALMRANNTAMRALMPLTTAFDAAAVKAQGQILVDNGTKMVAQYAAGTDQADTGVTPAVWTDAAGFKAAADKFTADAAKVGAATDGPSLQVALTAVNADCGGCHRTYRAAPAGRGARGPAPAAPPPAQ
ncbi:MAG: cytochrome c [Alphaproteobacteria bacterium]|nr:cytochrome c [Alphaproteobacteria bacterium]